MKYFKYGTTFFISVFFILSVRVQSVDSTHYRFLRQIYDYALTEAECYESLRHICKEIGPRLSGSTQAARAVDYTMELMTNYNFDRVFLQEVQVPVWVRGAKEEAYAILPSGDSKKLPVCALGGSVATPQNGLEAPLVMVHDFDELGALGKKNIKGKIVFFNRPMPPTCIHTFDAYGKTVDQRFAGAAEAAKYGAAGVVVRSMGLRNDDFPHTGSMKYYGKGEKIPAVAISTNGADFLKQELESGKEVNFYFKTQCKNLLDTLSHNVVGQIEGSDHKDKFIIAGGHLDSWDMGEGAHDDGAGTVQAIEALRILKSLGYKPKHSIRAVLFMNEENGMRGAKKYAELLKENNEEHVAAIESDRGGFTPRGFSFEGVDEESELIMFLKREFAPFNMLQWDAGYSAPDIRQLDHHETMLFGYITDSQRYFDVHHADSDVFETVHKRELELGAAAMAALIYLIDQKL